MIVFSSRGSGNNSVSPEHLVTVHLITVVAMTGGLREVGPFGLRLDSEERQPH